MDMAVRRQSRGSTLSSLRSVYAPGTYRELAVQKRRTLPRGSLTAVADVLTGKHRAVFHNCNKLSRGTVTACGQCRPHPDRALSDGRFSPVVVCSRFIAVTITCNDDSNNKPLWTPGFFKVKSGWGLVCARAIIIIYMLCDGRAYANLCPTRRKHTSEPSQLRMALEERGKLQRFHCSCSSLISVCASEHLLPRSRSRSASDSSGGLPLSQKGLESSARTCKR
jgi:hypothetical protein